MKLIDVPKSFDFGSCDQWGHAAWPALYKHRLVQSAICTSGGLLHSSSATTIPISTMRYNMDFVIIITGQSRNGQSDAIEFILLGLDTELLGRINDR